MQGHNFLAITVWLLILNAANLWTFLGMPTAEREADFFGVCVTPEVYRSVGRHLLRQYWLWLAAAFLVIEAACVLVPVYLDKLALGLYLQFAAAFLVPASGFVLLDVFHRKAEPFKVEGESRPAATFALSLRPRRLAQYTHWAFEAAVVILGVAALAALASRYPTLPGRIPQWVDAEGRVTEWARKSFSLVFSTPILLIAAQGWILLIKHARVQAPLRLPAERAGEYLRHNEAAIRLDMNFMDLCRGMCLGGVVAFTWGFIVMPAEEVHLIPPGASAAPNLFLAVLCAVWLAGFFYYLHRTRVINRKLRPVEAPDVALKPPDNSGFYAGGLIYYNPDDPARVVKGPRSFTLNWANQWSYIYLAGTLGVVLLMAWWLWATWLL